MVALCSNGLEAVESLDAASPDVVLMDLNMPVLNGAEATRQVLSRRPGLRILIFTATPGSTEAAQALDVGACGVVPKNVDPAALVRLLRT